MSHIHLFGDPLENFYILGKKDKDSYQHIYNQISSLCIRNKHLTKLLRIANELSQHLDRKKGHQKIHKELAAYAEGLEIPYQEILYSFLLPEIVSSFNKWVPDLLSLIPGCSSLFVPGTNGGVVHTRILDYALNESFTQSERSILYDFDDRYKSISYSCAGVPFPSLSAMNDQGLTLALHYKHGQHFNNHGESIFFMASEIINTCATIREAIKLIKKKSSISYWGLYLSDKHGEVASIDIRGKDIFQEKFSIEDHKYLYFNNRPLLKHENQRQLQPYGHAIFCQQKANYIHKMVEQNQDKLISDPVDTSLKILGSINTSKSKKFEQTAITASSIQLLSFDYLNQNVRFQQGAAPKIYTKDFIDYRNIFLGNFEMISNKNISKENTLAKGFRYWGIYQSSIDKGNINQAYHAIQMAIEFFKGRSEEYISRFYFNITQYIYETDKKDLAYLYQDLLDIEGHLPDYLNEHLQLFKMRYEKRLGLSISINADSFRNEIIKNHYLKEINISHLAMSKLKLLIFPRIELMDIIYTF